MNKKEKFWDRTARNYDQQVDADDETAFKILAHTIRYLRTNDIVLDYGCATGKFTFEIAGLVDEIHGIDISSKMIAIANENARERSIRNAHFMKTTIFDERLEPRSFNVILAFNILHLVEHPGQVVQRINALLQPGGLFISATPCMGKGRSFLPLILRALSKLGIVPKMNFFDPNDVEDLMGQGHFDLVETAVLSPSPPEYFVAAGKNPQSRG